MRYAINLRIFAVLGIEKGLEFFDECAIIAGIVRGNPQDLQMVLVLLETE